jgi:hypothetical protein
MKCSIREQFVNGNRVCSIVDWTMDWPVSSLTTTEILEVRNGEIVSGEVISTPRGFGTPWLRPGRGNRRSRETTIRRAPPAFRVAGSGLMQIARSGSVLSPLITSCGRDALVATITGGMRWIKHPWLNTNDLMR